MICELGLETKVFELFLENALVDEVVFHDEDF